jgi:hypothetical protein
MSDNVCCAYCKKEVSRNGYGKHLLSKTHLRQFKEENEKALRSKMNRNLSLSANPVKIKGETNYLCLCCKKFYSGSVNSKGLLSHFKDNKLCKDAHWEFADKLLGEFTGSNSKETENLKKRIVELEEDGEEASENNMRYFTMLKEMLGTYEINEMESRFNEFKEQGILPLYKN